MTAMTTVVAPFITPLWVKWLVRADVPMSYFAMMMEIIKIVIVPIGAALLHDHLKHAKPSGRKIVLGLAAASAVWLGFIAFGGWAWLKGQLPETGLISASVLGFFARRWWRVVYHWLTRLVTNWTRGCRSLRWRASFISPPSPQRRDATT